MSQHNHDQGTPTGLEAVAAVRYDAVDLALNTSFWVASRKWKIVDIRGRVDVLGVGGACTAIVRKAPSGTIGTSGTALHTGSFNLVGTIDTNQVLALSGTPADLEIAVGDCLFFHLTGTPTAAKGVVVVTLIPN